MWWCFIVEPQPHGMKTDWSNAFRKFEQFVNGSHADLFLSFHFISFKVKCMSCSHLHVTLLPSIQMHVQCALLLVPKCAFWYCEKTAAATTKKQLKNDIIHVMDTEKTVRILFVYATLFYFWNVKFLVSMHPNGERFLLCTFLHDKISFYGCIFISMLLCACVRFFSCC